MTRKRTLTYAFGLTATILALVGDPVRSGAEAPGEDPGDACAQGNQKACESISICKGWSVVCENGNCNPECTGGWKDSVTKKYT
jgi:hypothetical protein